MGNPQVLPHYRPAAYMAEVSIADNEVIQDARDELECRAVVTDSSCYGYYPDAATANNEDLTQSELFAARFPTVMHAGRTLTFQFLRLALVPQEPFGGLHVDAPTTTGLAETHASHDEGYEFWRLILNLGEQPRDLVYSLQHPQTMRFSDIQGFKMCVEEPDRALLRRAQIPPIKNGRLSGAIFCASHVLHMGADNSYGHFIAAYGMVTRT